MLKAQQEAPGSFRCGFGSVVFARLRGYLSSARAQGSALLVAFEAFFRGQLLYPVFP